MMQLYTYDHCPYCVKARMIFGLKQIPFSLNILLNDDETTPISMVGKKVVPILQKEDGSYMPESMDIVAYIDQYQAPAVLTGKTNPAIAQWLTTVTEYLHQLLMPRYAHGAFAEFATQSARDYYINKKQPVIGNFAEHLENTPALMSKINADLATLAKLMVTDSGCNGELSTDDIHLFAVLRGLSIVKGIDYPSQINAYRQKMSQLSGVKLLDNIAQ